MTTNNSINNTVTNNDFDVNLDTAGSSSVSSVVHSDNTNTVSHAELRLEVGGTSGGDPNIYFNIPSGSDYSLGIDNTVTDDLVITDSTSPSTGNNIFRLYSDGNRRLEKNPAFYAENLSGASNVTGDGTVYTIVANNENFDQNNDFNGTTTFTAPVTGKYWFCLGFGTGPWGAQTGSQTQFVTSNQTYNSMVHGNITNGATDTLICSTEIFADMDALDTCTFTVAVSGSTKTISMTQQTRMSGLLVV